MEKVIHLELNGKKMDVKRPKGAKKLILKYEHGTFGPLYWIVSESKWVNFVDGEARFPEQNKKLFYAQWFKERDAKKFAKFFEVPFDVC